MKEFFAFLALFLSTLILFVLLIGMAFTTAKAAEPVQDFVQCTYKPSQSDEVMVYCGSLKGTGSVAVRICGINYTIDVKCL
jgi:hypothetical protein